MKSLKIQALSLLAILAISCQDGGKPAAYGIIDAESRMISTSESGKIESLLISEGSKVSKEEVVGQIDTSLLSIQLRAFELQSATLRQTLPDVGKQMDVLRKKREALENEAERIRPLVKSGGVSKKQLDRMEDEINLAKSQERAAHSSLSRETASVLATIASLDAQADVVRDKIRRCKITNPMDGTVSRIFIKNQEFVVAGMPIYKLSDMENMFVDCWFELEQLGAVNLGDKVNVVADASGKVGKAIPGIIKFISEESEFTPTKVMTRDTRAKFVYRVRVGIKNDGTLKAGMPAEIYLCPAQ